MLSYLFTIYEIFTIFNICIFFNLILQYFYINIDNQKDEILYLLHFYFFFIFFHISYCRIYLC